VKNKLYESLPHLFSILRLTVTSSGLGLNVLLDVPLSSCRDGCSSLRARPI